MFEHEVFVLDSDPQKNTFEEKEEYHMTLNLITYAVLNNDEQILGVATVTAA